MAVLFCRSLSEWAFLECSGRRIYSGQDPRCADTTETGGDTDILLKFMALLQAE
ncbi:MAG: hypothetical protein R3F54_29120 [Alphaproteobacteria bacterium]